MATDRIIEQFMSDGYAVIPNFLTEFEIDSMKNSTANLIDRYNPEEQQTVFRTSEKQNADDYFITSGDKIRYFLEDGVIDENGKLTVNKNLALNKIGHALHWLDPVFKQITFSTKIKDLIKKCGLSKPVVPQSMYIFKNAGKGGEVIPHQDATYVFTEPQSLIGLWFPLEDATLENGCLWFQPGSHKGELEKRWIRNNSVKANSVSGPVDAVADGDGIKESAMTFQNLIDSKSSCYKDESKFIAAPAKKGSCVLIDGLVVHKSEKNTSEFPRPAYTFHIYDQQESIYSPQNWLQPSTDLPFPSLFDN